MPAERDLIFDLGANRGEDTRFYLAKGFRVVAVEADQALAAGLARDLSAPTAAGRLTVLPVGVAAQAGPLPFYANAENDHWSSFDPAYGARQGTRHTVTVVQCTTLDALFAAHGVPHYLKVDVEGFDRHVVAALANAPDRPRYVSVEEYGIAAIADLAASGYARFQLLPQRIKHWAVPPQPAREGGFVPWRFGDKDTGLFGAELPDAWLDADAAHRAFLAEIRAADGTYVGPEHEWWDIHAALP